MPPARVEHQPRPPEDFAPILAEAKPLLLVGGQAVNLWALYYEKRTGHLAPFVSRDVDILGDRETLISLAQTAGTKPQFFPLRPPTNEVGVVVAKDAQGMPLLVEVLRHVHGVTNEQLLATTYTVAIGATGVVVKVPGPVALLQAKIANVADLQQWERQDAKHVHILAALMPAYLADVATAVTAGRISERAFIDVLEHLQGIVTTQTACKALRNLQIDRELLFAELKAKNLPKVQFFIGKRLPRAGLSGTGTASG